jgi:hypothetical protein
MGDGVRVVLSGDDRARDVVAEQLLDRLRLVLVISRRRFGSLERQADRERRDPDHAPGNRTDPSPRTTIRGVDERHAVGKSVGGLRLAVDAAIAPPACGASPALRTMFSAGVRPTVRAVRVDGLGISRRR